MKKHTTLILKVCPLTLRKFQLPQRGSTKSALISQYNSEFLRDVKYQFQKFLDPENMIIVNGVFSYHLKMLR